MTDATSQFGTIAVPRREMRRRLAIILSLAFVVAAVAAALFIVQGVESQIRDVQHTHEVRRQAQALTQALVDAETGQRGYLLTQDPAYLEPYRGAVTTLDETYHTLLDMVADNPAQTVRLENLTESIEQKRSEMATTITMATEGRLSEALSILRSDAGRTLMDDIRQTLQQFIAEEDTRLVERNREMDSSRVMLTATIVIALAGAAILTFSLFNRTQQEVADLARTRSLLQSQNVELEERVRDRTTELEEARAHAERERARVEALLQETNHRIGNSLATVSSLLGLQVARTQSDEVKAALEAAQSRVQAIASGHRRLRLGADLETTRIDEFLQAAVEDLQATQVAGRPISLTTAVEPLVINARDATTIGIIVGELIINAVKHAFPDGRPGQIWLGLKRADESGAILMVEDDGSGISEEPGSDGGLGAMIIRQLAVQFGGEPSYAARTGGGTRVTVLLPKLDIGTTAAGT